MQAHPTFEVCIDESGDDGFVFEKPGCAHWFILSAVIYPRTNQAKITDLIKEIKTKINWNHKKPLHFKDIKGDKRQVLIEHLVRDTTLFRVVTIMVHKPCLSGPEAFQQKHTLYFYFTRFLLERVSWLCAASKAFKNPALGDGTARVTFSNRADLSYKEMQEYFNNLQVLQTSINWAVIRPKQFQTLTNGKHAGLQIADTVASSTFCIDHPCHKYKTLDWIAQFKPLIHRSPKGQYRGYGIKLFPEKQITQKAIAPWVIAIFPR